MVLQLITARKVALVPPLWKQATALRETILVAAVLMTWAYTFVNNQVTTQLSEQKIFCPAAGSPALEAQVDTLFQGTTLRGLLLNAYAFWQIGQILFIAFIVAYIAGAIMLILSLFGLWHSRRAAPQEELFGPKRPVTQPSAT